MAKNQKGKARNPKPKTARPSSSNSNRGETMKSNSNVMGYLPNDTPPTRAADFVRLPTRIDDVPRNCAGCGYLWFSHWNCLDHFRCRHDRRPSAGKVEDWQIHSVILRIKFQLHCSVPGNCPANDWQRTSIRCASSR